MFEILAALVFLLVVAAGLWRAGLPSVGLLVLSLGVVSVVSASVFAPDRSSTARVDAPIELVANIDGMPEGDYVGSATCLACHPGEHASFSRSFHPKMTQQAVPATVLGSFDGRVLQHEGVAAELSQHDGRYFAVVQAAGSRSRRVEIVQTTGSHHFQAYWFPSGEGRALELLPFAWRVETGAWIPITDAFLLPPGEGTGIGSGQWNKTCNGCHATRVEPRLSARGADTRAVEFGVRCEACHGPGHAHVEAQQSPVTRYAARLGLGSSGSQIVNPADLPTERSAEVCGQCHSVHSPRTETYGRWLQQGHEYRPGDRLAETRIVVQPRRGDEDTLAVLRREPSLFPTTFWPDGVLRVSGREYNGLIDSACYLRGEGDQKMGCRSCHSMHASGAEGQRLEFDVWRDDQLRDSDPDASCLRCHAPFQDSAVREQHTHHSAESDGSSCVNCHMSHTTYGLLKAIRSHTIEVPRVATELDTGRPNACNLCHLDRTLDWTAEHLNGWYGQPRADLDPTHREVAAGVRWALMGDAGLRALTAWSMGWEPAKRASAPGWIPNILATLMADDYAAVRSLAWRSVQTFPGVEGHFDASASAFERAEFLRGLDLEPDLTALRGRSELLVLPDGGFDRQAFQRLLARRDRRKVYLGE